jgi:hypothetical protein
MPAAAAAAGAETETLVMMTVATPSASNRRWAAHSARGDKPVRLTNRLRNLVAGALATHLLGQ